MPRPKKTDADHIHEELTKIISEMEKWQGACKFLLSYIKKGTSIESRFISDVFHVLVDQIKRLQLVDSYIQTKDEVSYYITPDGELRVATPEQKMQLLIRRMDKANFTREVRYKEKECLHSLSSDATGLTKPKEE